MRCKVKRGATWVGPNIVKPVKSQDARHFVGTPTGLADGNDKPVFWQLIQPLTNFINRDMEGVRKWPLSACLFTTYIEEKGLIG